jgi:hypothetical protein
MVKRNVSQDLNGLKVVRRKKLIKFLKNLERLVNFVNFLLSFAKCFPIISDISM